MTLFTAPVSDAESELVWKAGSGHGVASLRREGPAYTELREPLQVGGGDCLGT